MNSERTSPRTRKQRNEQSACYCCSTSRNSPRLLTLSVRHDRGCTPPSKLHSSSSAHLKTRALSLPQCSIDNDSDNDTDDDHSQNNRICCDLHYRSSISRSRKYNRSSTKCHQCRHQGQSNITTTANDVLETTC